MVKKLLVVVGLVSVVGFLRWGSHFPAKAEETGNKIAAWVDKKIKTRTPVEKPEDKLAHLRGRMKELDAEISAGRDRLAQQIVEQSRTSADLALLRESVDSDTKLLAARAKEIDDAHTETVSYKGTTMPISAARKQLDHDLDLVAARKELLTQTEEAAHQRDAAVAVTRQHVTALETMKLEAKTKLDKLDLELKTLRLVEVKDKFEANDTKAGKFLEAVKELEDMIEVKKVRRSLEPVKDAPVAAPTAKPAESASDAVARKLGLKPAAEKKIEKSSD